MTEIREVEAWEVLDSRGMPTVRVAVRTETAEGRFTVPAGASTGAHEAVERRDGGTRFAGQGVREAVDAVESELTPIVIGRDVTAQATIDEELVATDGTRNLERLGANAVLGVSGAVAHAASATLELPLYAYLARDRERRASMPVPMVNILSGGLHAVGGVAIQDYLVVPVGAGSYSEALTIAWEVRRTVRDRIVEAGDRPLLADEGGFSPPLDEVEEGFELLISGIEDAGYEPGVDVAFAVDVAATHFYDPKLETYALDGSAQPLDREAFVEVLREWVDRYPIVSIEDPLAEDDWDGWERLHEVLPDGIQLLGDDLLVTNTERLETALERDAANAVLVKPNQAGTMSRAIDVVDHAQRNGVNPVISARSGETCDSTIADLAVGLDAGQIKIGSLAQSERLAKYNRLLEIERTDDVVVNDPALDV